MDTSNSNKDLKHTAYMIDVQLASIDKDTTCSPEILPRGSVHSLYYL